MNKMQRTLLVAIAAIVLGMLVYAPYRVVFGSRIIDNGYGWIFSLGEYETLNFMTLTVQWLGVLIAGGLGFLALKSK